MRTISQGQFVAPRHAAEAYVASHYSLITENGAYSSHPGDYFTTPDDVVMGAIVRNDHSYRLITGRFLLASRVLKRKATMRDLRRLARAAETLVVS